MKKKIILLAIAVIALVSILTGCSKGIDVTNKAHDAILEADLNSYIGVDDGKSYLFNLKNSKKLFKTGYDSLKYVAANSGLASENYLVAYNSGDIGVSVLNAKGDIIIASTAEMKIDSVVLHQNLSFNENKLASYTDKLIVVNFYNDENSAQSAAFKTDGSAIYYDKNGNVGVSYADTEANDDSQAIEYVFAIATGEIENVPNKTVKYDVFDGNLTSIYTKNFTKDIVFLGDGIDEYSLAFVNYRETATDQTTTNYTDVFAGGKAYTGYTALSDTLNDSNANSRSYVLSTFNKTTSTTSYTIINKTGIVKSFDNTYTVYNNQLRLANAGKLDIVDYNGTTLLSGVVVMDNDYYTMTQGDVVTLYNMKGQSLFDYSLAATTSVNGTKIVDNLVTNEYFVITSTASEIEYKYFQDGILVKTYNKNYTYESTMGNAMIFSTKDGLGIKNNYYTYDILANAENIVAVNAIGNMDTEISDNISISGVGTAYYYVTKESNDIVFYSGIAETITPYKGDKVASYSIVGGVYNMSVSSFWYMNNRHSVITIGYEALTKTEVVGSNPLSYTYESTNEILYAYYLLEDITLGTGLIELYSGYNMANIEYDDDYDTLLISTMDKFFDEGLTGLNRYGNVDKLVDKTIVYKVAYDELKKSMALTVVSEFAASNIKIITDKYLMNIDYTITTSVQNNVFKYDGSLVLASKYRVTTILGDLATISIGGGSGIYNLKKGKVLEEAIHFNTTIINPNLYRISTIEKNGTLMTIKDASGKKVVDNCYSCNTISQVINFEESTMTEFLIIYLGKDEFKLMSVVYEYDYSKLF